MKRQIQSKGGAYSGTKNQDAGEFRNAIRSYDPAGEFSAAIKDGAAFSRFGVNEQIKALDLMCGPGKLGKMLEEHAAQTKRNVEMHYNDLSAENLAKIDAPAERKIACDAMEISRHAKGFDLIVVRYGIKDIVRDLQVRAIWEAREALKKRGRLLIADMTASRLSQPAVNNVHRMKQEFAGRDPKLEGVCHIPTLSEWKKNAQEAGFRKVRFIKKKLISPVDTMDWLNQFGCGETESMRKILALNSYILAMRNENREFGVEFNVRTDGDRVKLDFPIMVMIAE
jgi:ubiquinone/menaquinone biosynthesis C-methylase UbiE